jgi:hypothetical protein
MFGGYWSYSGSWTTNGMNKNLHSHEFRMRFVMLLMASSAMQMVFDARGVRRSCAANEQMDCVFAGDVAQEAERVNHTHEMYLGVFVGVA